jgi:hypothetical protein
MLWWWLVGESRDIRWMRNWFATFFVVRLAENRTQDVRDALIHVNSEPDEWSSFSRDRLVRVTEVTEALRKSSSHAMSRKRRPGKAASIRADMKKARHH